MRLIVSLAVFGILVCAGLPAMAQNTTTATTNSPVMYAVPIYNNAGTQYYGSTGTNTPVYNNAGAQPLPMQQMIAGKNSPSYVSPGNAYTGFGGNSMNGNMSSPTVGQVDRLAAYREAMAQKSQADYMATLQQQQQGQQNPYAQSASQYYNQFMQPQQQQAPVKRRVLYKELNNPLVTPPRLFNPDQ